MLIEKLEPGTMLVTSKKHGTMFSTKVWDFSINEVISRFSCKSIAIVIRHHPMMPQFLEVVTSPGVHGWISKSAIEEV